MNQRHRSRYNDELYDEPTTEDVNNLIKEEKHKDAYELSKKLVSALTISEKCEDYSQAMVICNIMAQASLHFAIYLKKQPEIAAVHFKNAAKFTSDAENLRKKIKK